MLMALFALVIIFLLQEKENHEMTSLIKKGCIRENIALPRVNTKKAMKKATKRAIMTGRTFLDNNIGYGGNIIAIIWSCFYCFKCPCEKLEVRITPTEMP